MMRHPDLLGLFNSPWEFICKYFQVRAVFLLHV